MQWNALIHPKYLSEKSSYDFFTEINFRCQVVLVFNSFELRKLNFRYYIMTILLIIFFPKTSYIMSEFLLRSYYN